MQPELPLVDQRLATGAGSIYRGSNRCAPPISLALTTFSANSFKLLGFVANLANNQGRDDFVRINGETSPTRPTSRDPLRHRFRSVMAFDRTGESRKYQQVKRISKRPTLKSAMPSSQVQCPFCKREFSCALGDFRLEKHRTPNGLPCMGSGGVGTPR